MAQTFPRKTLTLFGSTGSTSDFGQFGSQAASAPLETKDIESIQGLSAWSAGWQSAVALGQAPYLQDMNGVMYVHSYEQCYSLVEGVPEWDSGTTYDKGSIVKLPYTGSVGSAQFFVSLSDANLNNALPTAPMSNASWAFLCGLTGTGLVIPGTIAADSAAAGMVGEYIESTVQTTNSPTSGQYGDLTSITLSAGDWDLIGQMKISANGASLSGAVLGGISTHSGNNSTGLVAGDNLMGQPSVTSASISIFWRQTISGSTTYYLKANNTFSGGTPVFDAKIAARRRR